MVREDTVGAKEEDAEESKGWKGTAVAIPNGNNQKKKMMNIII